jgi:hypothetical protein
MKNVIIFALTLSLASCGNSDRRIDDGLYRDLDVVILDMGGNSPRPSKHSHDGKYFYVMSVKDTALRSEFSRANFHLMSDSFYYNHKVGDTLHFDFIRKSRFFKVTR